ncbi:MAG: sugar phosphate isomerase/epimerase [Polynucleobacter sp.]|uniref:sugar phosphate isomerase/epimerase family protein n=1 Tax=Polynucleobacter sp. TaxID=2029855 RepID=UPI00271F6900|nr:sugar phosphate isomerase/epimerase [Polynucleobacter sp.]MDO8714695.1 sugar phosphate isomerase/epimerase [Polynucleobacter sp.]
MRLAISNIAWDVPEDETIAQLLNHYNVDAIDIAPGKYFPDPNLATDEDIARIKNWWFERGIEITGMQALLFGTTGLNVFATHEVQEKLFYHLEGICRIGGHLGATRIVFGSPKNRDRTGLSDQEAHSIAVSFFRRLGDIAQSHGVIICLEPNPICYGANFMTTSQDTALVVEAIAHPAVKMQLDTGALTINEEDVLGLLQEHAQLIGHIHASEADLLPLGDGTCDHAYAFRALQQYTPTHLVTIEMVATKNEPHVQSIERALKIAIKNYRNHLGVLHS